MVPEHSTLTSVLGGGAAGGGSAGADYNFSTPGADAGQAGEPMIIEGVDRPRLRVLIVDDHAVVRAGFKRILEASDDLEATGEAGTAAEALALVAAGRYDVVMLDISLPDANVLETVATLRRRHPTLPILIVSMHPEDQYAVNLLRAGASGFFAKAGEAEDLLIAIRLVASGRKYVSSALAEALALEATGAAREPPHRQLSSREFQVFIGLAAGKTVTSLADDMFLSVKTVSTYRTRVLAKMNLSRNADLTTYALRHNLLG
jgi:DNA-binding NarL/FixJ family response regulator